MRYFRRTRAIALKELTQMVRDPRVVYLALGLPVVMLVLFGFGVSMDIDHLPLAVVDQDGTPASRRLRRVLSARRFEMILVSRVVVHLGAVWHGAQFGIRNSEFGLPTGHPKISTFER